MLYISAPAAVFDLGVTTKVCGASYFLASHGCILVTVEKELS